MSWRWEPLEIQPYDPSWTESFEDNSSADWEVWDSNLSLDSNAYDGSQSAYYGTSATSSVAERKTVDGGSQISWLSYWYYETSNSTGHGVRLKNSDGGFEVGAATDNPQFHIDDTSGPTDVSTGNASYETWTKCKFTFDWGNGEVTIEFSNNSSATHTGSLKQGVDIETVELWTYHSGGGYWGDGNSSKVCYWDLIEWEP